MAGKIFLVGAGPGDPDLITVKGKKYLEKADCIIYDYLSTAELLKYAKKSAEIIYVGKKGSNHTLGQDGINELLVQKAKEHKIVVRLKGGDPFIFGRGGEEAEFIIAKGIEFEVVPGVTSAISAPAYAGIPLTHRNFTSSVSIITGHEKSDSDDFSKINWEILGKSKETLVFLMGVGNLKNICSKLIKNGKNPKTLIALIHWGTTPKQKVAVGDLTNIEKRVKEAKITAPSIIVIGEVVRLRETLNWFEKKPLFGKKIIITRARIQNSILKEKLSNLGAHCFEFPVIKPTALGDTKKIDRAIENLNKYDWLIFTSVNGVQFFFDKLNILGKDARALGSLKTACIGPATQEKLLKFGIKSDILPNAYVAEAVIEAFKKEDMKGKKVLLPRAKNARVILPNELKKMGADVDEIITYCAKPVTNDREKLLNLLKTKKIDFVTFTSSSTVQNFKNLIYDKAAITAIESAKRDDYKKQINKNFEEYIKDLKVASIGPITTKTAKDLGFKISIEAKEYTIKGLIKALISFN